MARPELGTKRVCPTTGRKFYDLGRDPIVSPYTGEVLPRAAFEPASRLAPVPRARPAEAADDEEEVEVAETAETVSLEDVADSEEAAAGVEDEAGVEDGDTADDTFLVEEEEGGDVADFIDNDIEEEEES